MTAVGPDINNGGKGLAVIWALNAVSITIVIARCMTQRFIIRQLGLSDALVVVSMCTISSMAALITVQYHYGWGRHYAYLDPFDRIEAMKYNAIGQSFGVMGSTFGRMSFIILMIQLFGTSKLKHAALWTLFWVQFIPNCIVVVTFAFVGVILKIVYIGVLADRGDYTYNTVPFFVWVQVESNLVVIASSVPLLRPLFIRLKSGDFSTRNGSTAPTFELSGYSNKRKSIQNNHMFSEISDDDLGMKHSRDGIAIDDKRSEDHILPIQGEKERVLEPWVVKKEVSYSVRVEDTADEDLGRGESERERGRNHVFLMPKRASKGSMSVLSQVSVV
ncbi:hypothetical protein ACHAPG_008586 [Botrytis cinerea]